MHLLRRAATWVEEQYGVERAAADRDAASKLALSMLCAVVPGDSDGKTAAEIIVRLLGGTKPHALAEVDEEGGSVTAGTLGTLQGDAAQASIRAAFRLWAVGVAHTFGVVFIAQAQAHAQAASAPAPHDQALLGIARDFGVDELLRQVPPLLPLPELLSICHFLTTRVAAAASRHRNRPGAAMADVAEIVSFMDAEVVHSRLRDYRQVSRAAAQAARLLGRHPPADTHATGSHSSSRGSGPSTARAKTSTDTTTTSVGPPPPPPGLPSGAAKPPQLGSANPTDVSDGLFQRRLPAVQAFQVEMRTRLGLDPGRPHGAAEPCAWRALTGKCKASGTCLSCQSSITPPDDLVLSIVQRSKRGLFTRPTEGGA